MFAGFCGHADKNHIYTVLRVTTGRAGQWGATKIASYCSELIFQ